jgi:hypothetical protein
MRRVRADYQAWRAAPSRDRVTALRDGTVLSRLIFLDGKADERAGPRANGRAHRSPAHATRRCAPDNGASGGTVARPLPHRRVTGTEKRRQ